jgi:hypothetical protein
MLRFVITNGLIEDSFHTGQFPTDCGRFGVVAPVRNIILPLPTYSSHPRTGQIWAKLPIFQFPPSSGFQRFKRQGEQKRDFPGPCFP